MLSTVAQCASPRKPFVALGAFDFSAGQWQMGVMNLTAIRRARDLSQEDLGDMIGMHKSTISRAESMDLTVKLLTFKKCADALGVTLADIFAEPVSPDERDLLDVFRQMSDAQRMQLRALLDVVAAFPPAVGQE